MKTATKKKVVPLSEDRLNPESGGIAVLELPCGILDKNGKVHREVVIREMTGHEEDLLANAQAARGLDVINLLLHSVIEKIGEVDNKNDIGIAVQSMHMGDRQFLMLQLRRLSLGDDYVVGVKCPSCNTAREYQSNLGSLRKAYMPNPEKREWDVTLPSGIKVTLRHITGKDAARLDRLRDDYPNDLASAALSLRVKKIQPPAKEGEEQAPPQEVHTPEQLKPLTSRDRRAIRAELAKADGGIESELEFHCPECGTDFRADLPLDGASFFFPSENDDFSNSI